MAGIFAAMFATSPGQTFVISNFNRAIGDGLGLEPADLAGAYLIGTLLSAGSLTFAGRLADRVGPRHMIGLASIGLAAAGFALSRATGFATLALAFYLLRFFGQGVLSMATSHALALRFDAKLGSVEGLKGATFSSAIALMPQVAVALIATEGWRQAAWIIPAAAGALGLASAYWLLDRDPPAREPVVHEVGAEDFTLAAARRTRAFWTLVGASAFTGMWLTAVHFHLQPILAESGMGEAVAAATYASFAASGFAATLIGGVLVDRGHPARLLGAGLTLLCGGMACIAAARTPAVAHAGMAVLGFGHGLVGATAGTTLARYFGRAHHGAIRGASSTAVVAGAAAGPYVLGVLAEPLGGFSRALLAVTVAVLPLTVLAWSLRRPR